MKAVEFPTPLVSSREKSQEMLEKDLDFYTRHGVGTYEGTESGEEGESRAVGKGYIFIPSTIHIHIINLYIYII